MDKEKNLWQKLNYSSFTTTQAETQSSNSSRNRKQSIVSLAKKTQSRWVIDCDDSFLEEKDIQECRFVSLTKHYENLSVSKVAQKQAKMNQKQVVKKQKADDYMSCFCGKKYKLKHTFQQHLIEKHTYRVQSVEYLHNKLQFEQKYFRIAKFENEQHSLLVNIRNSSSQQLLIPCELKNLFSQKQKQKIVDSAHQFVKANSKIIEKLRQQKGYNTDKTKNFYFTQVFLENIRKIAIKHVEVYNRRAQILLKNSSYKDVFSLYIYNLFEVLSEFKKYKKDKIIVPLSIMIEQKGEEFLNWIDHNYKQVLDRKNIFYNHIELNQNQKYSEVQRINKKILFTQQFLFHVSKSKQSGFELKNLQFLLQNFSFWAGENIQ